MRSHRMRRGTDKWYSGLGLVLTYAAMFTVGVVDIVLHHWVLDGGW